MPNNFSGHLLGGQTKANQTGTSRMHQLGFMAHERAGGAESNSGYCRKLTNGKKPERIEGDLFQMEKIFKIKK